MLWICVQYEEDKLSSAKSGIFALFWYKGNLWTWHLDSWKEFSSIYSMHQPWNEFSLHNIYFPSAIDWLQIILPETQFFSINFRFFSNQLRDSYTKFFHFFIFFPFSSLDLPLSPPPPLQVPLPSPLSLFHLASSFAPHYVEIERIATWIAKPTYI